MILLFYILGFGFAWGTYQGIIMNQPNVREHKWFQYYHRLAVLAFLTGSLVVIRFDNITLNDFDFSFLIYIIGLAILGWEFSEIGYSYARYKTLIPVSENFLGLNLYIEGVDVLILHKFRLVIGGLLSFIGGMS